MNRDCFEFEVRSLNIQHLTQISVHAWNHQTEQSLKPERGNRWACLQAAVRKMSPRSFFIWEDRETEIKPDAKQDSGLRPLQFTLNYSVSSLLEGLRLSGNLDILNFPWFEVESVSLDITASMRQMHGIYETISLEQRWFVSEEELSYLPRVETDKLR